MKPVTESKMKVLRWCYAILLMILITVLAVNDILDSEWLLWVIIGGGLILGFAIESFLKAKYPETFPKSAKEKEIDRIFDETDEDKEDEKVKLPRTLFSTLCEVVTVPIVAYATYRAWTHHIGYLSFIILSIIPLIMLFNAYQPNIKKDPNEPVDMRAYQAVGNKTRINAIFVALAVLLMTYCVDQDGWLRWRPIYLGFSLWYAIWTCVKRLLSRRCDALMAKANNCNPAYIRVAHTSEGTVLGTVTFRKCDALMAKTNKFNLSGIRVGRTFEGTAFEIVTVVMLIGAWCAAAIRHQLTGREFLDIPIADLTMCSVFAIGLLILAYFPKWMNDASSFKNNEQVLASIKRHRIAAVILAFFALIIPFIPNLTEQTLGYLYVVVFAILTFSIIYKKTEEQEQKPNNE